MPNVEIEFFNIASTKVNQIEVKRWLTHVGADNFVIPEDGAVSDPALLIALAAKRCYMSFEAGLNPNVTKVRKDYVEFFDNILKSGHGSVLEHAVFTFAIEGVSRVFTAEMNRHRAGWAISEGSLRYIRFTDIPWWMPLSMREKEGDSEDLANRKKETRDKFKQAFEHQEQMYTDLLNIWTLDEAKELGYKGKEIFEYKKKLTSQFRRIVGLGVATGGVWSGNVRALRHVLAMRCSPAAEEEICHVFSRIALMMRDKEPLLFGDFYENDDGYWVPEYVKV